jgi:Domain of unknown function (DUF4258)
VSPEYSSHARRQMQKRGITEADVERALNQRIGPPGPGQPGTIWIRGFAIGGRVLKVCVRTNDHNYVVTAAWPDA